MAPLNNDKPEANPPSATPSLSNTLYSAYMPWPCNYADIWGSRLFCSSRDCRQCRPAGRFRWQNPKVPSPPGAIMKHNKYKTNLCSRSSWVPRISHLLCSWSQLSCWLENNTTRKKPCKCWLALCLPPCLLNNQVSRMHFSRHNGVTSLSEH